MLRIGTRGSQLARAQANWVRARLAEAGHAAELVIIQTHGDLLPNASLTHIGGKGVFVKELENALLANAVDLAVHSLKDLPTEMPEGLTIAAIPERVDPRDVICCRHRETLDSLAGKATLATSSLRRRAQLLASRPDLQMIEVRGNLDTRLRKLAEGQFDALALAAAGLIRMGWQDQISEYLAFDICLPAPGQGAIALESRLEDRATNEAVTGLEHATSRTAVTVERAFLAAMGGGCLAPIGAAGIVNDEELLLRGMVASPDGRRMLRDKARGTVSEAAELGTKLAEQLLAAGGAEILAAISPPPTALDIAP